MLHPIQTIFCLVIFYWSLAFGQQSITIINPDSTTGNLYGGQYYDINWISTGIDSIELWLSYDSGINWELIKDSYPAETGTYR